MTTNTAFDEYVKLLSSDEPLHPDLAAYLVKKHGKTGFPCLKHPLVFAVPYFDQQNAIYNRQYTHKQECLEKALRERDWGSYIFLHERPNRFEAFFEISDSLTDTEYWELLGEVWTDSENLWQIDFISELLNENRGSRECIMNPQEREFLHNLPDKFMIYRGHHKVNCRGYSWTLSYNKAKWFAKRYQNGNGYVACGSVHKKDVIAYFSGRNEFEIVVEPSKVEFKTLRKLKRPGILPLILDDCIEVFSLRHSVHGPSHWEKVERNAIYLAKRTKGADVLVCRLFAIIHDCQRENDNDDPEHGYRAADFILKNSKRWMLGQLGDKRMEKLLYACRLHNDGQVSDDPTIGVCWDADRLDLPRVGIAPDPKLLSTEAGRSSIWLI